MICKSLISLSISLFILPGFTQTPEKVNLNRFLPEGFEINSLGLTTDSRTGFFTASLDWEKQIPYLVTFGQDTVVERLLELDTIYNGAISPSGNQLIYCVRGGEYTTIYLTKKVGSRWSAPINLSASSGITGGYFHWYSETELYFYTPDNNGDLVSGELQNEELEVRNRFNSLNTQHTEFSPFMGPDKRYLLFTRYVEGEASQQGIMFCKNVGSTAKPVWSKPRKIEGIPYGWGAFVQNGRLVFSDGINIHRIETAILRR